MIFFSSISSILKSDLKSHFLVSHQAFHTWMPVHLSMALLLPVTRTPPPNIANKPLEKNTRTDEMLIQEEKAAPLIIGPLAEGDET